jgi:hypothetical protein
MQKRRHNGRAPTKTSVESEIAHLRGLDLKGLRARWQSVFRRQAPAHLTRHLLFAVIAYRLQADRFGDLDHATLQVLDQRVAKEKGPAMSARLASFDLKRTELSPGTVLVREWDRRSQQVMVMADGFAWNGQTYDSLSKVAFAITGTRWNGPRFFGLRDRQDRPAVEARRSRHPRSNRSGVRSIRGSLPSMDSIRSSTRWMRNTMPPRPISRARPMPAGP